MPEGEQSIRSRHGFHRGMDLNIAAVILPRALIVAVNGIYTSTVMLTCTHSMTEDISSDKSIIYIRIIRLFHYSNAALVNSCVEHLRLFNTIRKCDIL